MASRVGENFVARTVTDSSAYRARAWKLRGSSSRIQLSAAGHGTYYDHATQRDRKEVIEFLGDGVCFEQILQTTLAPIAKLTSLASSRCMVCIALRYTLLIRATRLHANGHVFCAGAQFMEKAASQLCAQNVDPACLTRKN